MTKIYLTVDPHDVKIYPNLHKSKYILGSYYYWKNVDIEKAVPNADILMDSGVFTMFNKGKPTKEDIEKYVDNYIDYINKHGIEKYVEMDLDVFFSYDYILKLRKKLEKGTRRKSIPIWHVSRGKEKFIKMCKEYDYAGIGGIVSREAIKDYKHLYKDLNKLASSYGCKLHAMGFTPTKDLYKYRFYSSDSTSWKLGNRSGNVYIFKNNKLLVKQKPKNTKIMSYKKLDNFNALEWIKYQKYCDQFNK